MGARKLYEERIMELIKNMPEEQLPKVISMIEKVNSNKEEIHDIIEAGFGKYAGKISVDEFLQQKQEEKNLDK